MSIERIVPQGAFAMHMPHSRRKDPFRQYLLATTIASRIRPALAAVAGERWTPNPDGTISVASATLPHAARLRVVDESAWSEDRTAYIGQLSPENVAALLSLVESAEDAAFGARTWVATSDALPATATSVLVWHRNDGHKVLRYLPPRDADDASQGWFALDGQPVPSARVLAWQALPPAFPRAETRQPVDTSQAEDDTSTARR